MLKKRIIFTLLYDSGFFMLSRNFRLQRVGDLKWLQRNYDFSHIAFFIDELIVLDVTSGESDKNAFCQTLKELARGCFVPIAAGGGIQSSQHARHLLRNGADKIVVNTALFEDFDLVRELSLEFGQQCIIGSVDLKKNIIGNYQIVTARGTRSLELEPSNALGCLEKQAVGELYLNSIDRDGTGQGYDFDLLEQVPISSNIPIILAGGVGNGTHLAMGLNNPRVDAVATANLFNFVGDGLLRVRESLLQKGENLAIWPHLSQIKLTHFSSLENG